MASTSAAQSTRQQLHRVAGFGSPRVSGRCGTGAAGSDGDWVEETVPPVGRGGVQQVLVFASFLQIHTSSGCLFFFSSIYLALPPITGVF